MQNIIILIIIIFSISNVSGQNTSTNKKELLILFRKERNYNSKQFKVCNTNEKFFKKDTVNFYSHFNPENCKNFIIWDFKNKKTFTQVVGENHGEYQSTKITFKKDVYKIKTFEKNGELFLKVYQEKLLVDIYKIFRIEKDSQVERITLIRLKKQPAAKRY